MFLELEELEKRKVHNNDLECPQVLKKGKLINSSVIVKLFYYDRVTTTDSGVLDIRYKVEETDGGSYKAVIDDQEFQPRGVVIKVADNVTDVKEGDIVWVSPQIAYNPLYDFLLDRETPVSLPEGYKKITVNAIEFIEIK
jgi:hypothetical protein